MSDPVDIKDANDQVVPVATDQVAGLGRVQIIKPAFGVDGAATFVSPADPLPVVLPPGAATEASLSTVASRLPATPAAVVTSPPSSDAAGSVVRQAPIDVFVCSFSDVGSGVLTADLTQRRLGTGVGVSQSAGNLVVTTGTTTNAEFLARSVRSFNGALTARSQTVLSQRIANQNFVFLLADLIGEGLACTINSATSITVTRTAHGLTASNVGQSMFVGAINGAAGVPGRWAIASVPTVDTINFTVAGWPASGSCTVDLFGWNHYRLAYSGTTATNALFDAQRRGWASGDTTLTISTTASPGHIASIANDGRNAYVADMLAATSTTPTITTRGSRYANLPDPDVELYLYVWSFNGAVAPASTTTWTVGFLSVEDTTNNVVYLGGVRPQGTAAPLPVIFPAAQAVSGTVTANIGTGALAAGANAIGDVGIQFRANATGAASTHHIVSAASTNALNIKAGAGRVVGWCLVNTTASFQYVKLHNTAGAPTAGAGVVQTIAIPPNGVNVMPVGGGGIGFATGIARTIVTGSADADATATTAGSVVGDIFFA